MGARRLLVAAGAAATVALAACSAPTETSAPSETSAPPGPSRAPASSSPPAPPVSSPGRPVPDVPVADVQAHLVQLQRIAEANGGNRAHGRPGHLAGLEYVRSALDAAGYTTTLQEFSSGGTGYNLVADWPGGDENAVMMFGAHADGVAAGPGINDNGSGTAALLEVALTVAEQDPRPARQLRFAWWGAEEVGLVGSAHYVRRLPADELERIDGYLNFDMIASPNGGYFVYSSSGQPEGSAAFERLLNGHFADAGIETEPVDLAGRSDHAPFADAGIPTGGVFTGAEGTKTPEQARKWGGTAGKPFDPCYHRACDTTANIDPELLGRTTAALAAAVWTLSQEDG
ncbi:M28 family metallopeptidase [Actinophytocola xanthii]|uniref:Peptidase M28 n=1 Tax=Actinophytocola xanthii TaxID=1912961 RepID=A0A1Q8CNZ5_9PSEU|nr:M28 family metallopeptidase [Actinophytocola xanthii]OLF16084.1 peptidase M28 [Actinophytocola xanthii]